MILTLASRPLALSVLLYATIGLLAAFLAYIFLLGLQLFRYATRRQEKDREISRAGASQTILDLVETMRGKNRELFGRPHDRLQMKREGLTLAAAYFPAEEKDEKGKKQGCAVVVHGWRDSHVARSASALDYLAGGYSVLMPVLRGHGESQGRRIDLGCQHYRDLFAWMDQIRQREDAPDYFILDGLSMGASTVLMASGDPGLPPDVLAVLADCGYSSLLEEGRWITRGMGKLTRKPAFAVTLFLFWLVMGYRLHDATPLGQVARASCPIFIIHGKEDNFVPTVMGEELFAAASSPMKELWLVEGAGHAMSEWEAGALYWQRKEDFLQKVWDSRKL